MGSHLQARLVKLETVRSGRARSYVIRTDDADALREAQASGRKVALMPSPCQTTDEWLARYAIGRH